MSIFFDFFSDIIADDIIESGTLASYDLTAGECRRNRSNKSCERHSIVLLRLRFERGMVCCLLYNIISTSFRGALLLVECCKVNLMTVMFAFGI